MTLAKGGRKDDCALLVFCEHLKFLFGLMEEHIYGLAFRIVIPFESVADHVLVTEPSKEILNLKECTHSKEDRAYIFSYMVSSETHHVGSHCQNVKDDLPIDTD